jgi:ribosomal protein S18 acetylase RimI-like enzyme
MSEPVLIRKADSKDIDHLINLENKCFDAHQFDKQQFKYYLTQNNCICYLIYNKDIFGYILGIIDHRGKKKKARLYSLAVLQGFRKKGYASMLLREFENEVVRSGAYEITLEVSKKNENALKLYVDTSYQFDKVIKDYYGKNKPALRMHKFLK